MEDIYLLLGSNLGNRRRYLQQAIEQIGKQIGCVKQVSSVYESEAWGFESKQAFLNQVIHATTLLTPEQVLGQISIIEQHAGRHRDKSLGYQSRSLDVDILFYNNLVIDTESLQLPHPRLHLRMFTLIPLVEIAPELQHPVLKQSAKQLLQNCNDSGKVRVNTLDDY